MTALSLLNQLINRFEYKGIYDMDNINKKLQMETHHYLELNKDKFYQLLSSSLKDIILKMRDNKNTIESLLQDKDQAKKFKGYLIILSVMNTIFETFKSCLQSFTTMPFIDIKPLLVPHLSKSWYKDSIEYEAFKETAQTGDILLFSSNAETSNIIKICNQSPFSHSGIVIKGSIKMDNGDVYGTDNGEVLILHSIQDFTVMVKNDKKVIADYEGVQLSLFTELVTKSKKQTKFCYVRLSK